MSEHTEVKTLLAPVARPLPLPNHCRYCEQEVLMPPSSLPSLNRLSSASGSLFRASASLGREFKSFNKVNALNLIPRGSIPFVEDNEKSEFRPAPNYTLHRSLQLAYMLLPSTRQPSFSLTVAILQAG